MSSSPGDPTSDVGQDGDDDEDDDLAHIALAEHLNQMELETVEDKFFGQSRLVSCPPNTYTINEILYSAFMLIQHGMMAKQQYLGRVERHRGRDFRRPTYWDIRPVSSLNTLHS